MYSSLKFTNSTNGSYSNLYITSCTLSPMFSKYKCCKHEKKGHVITNITYQQIRCDTFSSQQDIPPKDITNKCVILVQTHYHTTQHNQFIHHHRETPGNPQTKQYLVNESYLTILYLQIICTRTFPTICST